MIHINDPFKNPIVNFFLLSFLFKSNFLLSNPFFYPLSMLCVPSHSSFTACCCCCCLVKKGLFNNSIHTPIHSLTVKCLFSLHCKQHKPHIIYPNNKAFTIGSFSLSRLPLYISATMSIKWASKEGVFFFWCC